MLSISGGEGDIRHPCLEAGDPPYFSHSATTGRTRQLHIGRFSFFHGRNWKKTTRLREKGVSETKTKFVCGQNVTNELVGNILPVPPRKQFRIKYVSEIAIGFHQVRALLLEVCLRNS